MRAPNSGERKLTELDFIRPKKFTAAGTFPRLADILDDAQLLPSRAVPPAVGPAGEETVARMEGILFQPKATGDYVA